MTREEKIDAIIHAVGTTSRCIMVISGVVWDGFLTDFYHGKAIVLARPLDQPAAPRVRREVAFEDLQDLAPTDPDPEPGSVDADPELLEAARELKRIAGLSTAEQQMFMRNISAAPPNGGSYFTWNTTFHTP